MYACSVCLSRELPLSHFKEPGRACYACKAGGVCTQCAKNYIESIGPDAYAEALVRCPFCRQQPWGPPSIRSQLLSRRGRGRRRRTGFDLWSDHDNGALIPGVFETAHRGRMVTADTKSLTMSVLVDRLAVIESPDPLHTLHTNPYSEMRRIVRILNGFRCLLIISACTTLIHTYTLIACLVQQVPFGSSAYWMAGLATICGQATLACRHSWYAGHIAHNMTIISLRAAWSPAMMHWCRSALKDMMAMSLAHSSIEVYFSMLTWMGHYQGKEPQARTASTVLLMMTTILMARFIQNVFVHKCECYCNQAAFVLRALDRISREVASR